MDPSRIYRFAPLAALVTGLSLAGWLGNACAKEARLERLPAPTEILPGRATPMPLPPKHLVFGTRLDIAPPGTETAIFAMGCFWGAEEHFFHLPGVVSTAVGYAGGGTPNPSYEEVSTGRTGHAESVRVVFDPKKVSYQQLLQLFWESHDPTQGMRQGNDVGNEYRSAIFATSPAQLSAALASRDSYARALSRAGYGPITTEIRQSPTFYFAEAYHQQYCVANPQGYCGHGGTGVAFRENP
jgi:peptide-methionine (S)-S-oxide reductase